MKFFLLFAGLWVFYASVCLAGLFDATEDLEGMVVLHAGDVELLDCPPYGKYDCLSWPSMLLKFRYKEICFTSDTGACSGAGCRGFVAAGTDEIPYYFTTDSFSGDISKYRARFVRCPDMY
ncbi:MAG: hypothetical protein DBP02_01975 [gamma proteobacterium symbiont of Ctena orbiculata]|nr:MAG: hypothetical protein DBP02_01975 [gamma proteobacterium symbiont of Ctena orbiculata]